MTWRKYTMALLVVILILSGMIKGYELYRMYELQDKLLLSGSIVELAVLFILSFNVVGLFDRE